MNMENQQKQIGQLAEQNEQIDANDEAEEQCVPNWLIETLKFLNRNDLVNSALSYSCRLFQQLCWPKLHGNVEAHSVPFLSLRRNNLLSPAMAKALLTDYKYCQNGLPIPCIAPPDYITGFEQIKIRFLNDQVVKFIESTVHRMHKISLHFSPADCMPNKESIKYANARKQIGRLLGLIAPKLHYIQIENCRQNVDEFVAIYPGILDRCVWFDKLNDLTAEWLGKWWPDKAQKIAILYFERCLLQIMEKIKKEFLASTQPVNFCAELLPLSDFDDFPQFTIENELTGEVLAAYKKPRELDYESEELVLQSHFYQRLLVRHPKGEGPHWREKGKRQLKKMEGTTVPNLTQIDLDETEFWPSDEQMQSNEKGDEQSSVQIGEMSASDQHKQQQNLAENSEMLKPCCSSLSKQSNISSSEPEEAKEKRGKKRAKQMDE